MHERQKNVTQGADPNRMTARARWFRREGKDGMEVSITSGVLIIASLVFVFVLSKLNSAIKLLNNRINIISHAQKQLKREFEVTQGTTLEDEFEAQERELRARLERDFR